jgi:hypothetical protein
MLGTKYLTLKSTLPPHTFSMCDIIKYNNLVLPSFNTNPTIYMPKSEFELPCKDKYKEDGNVRIV